MKDRTRAERRHLDGKARAKRARKADASWRRWVKMDGYTSECPARNYAAVKEARTAPVEVWDFDPESKHIHRM